MSTLLAIAAGMPTALPAQDGGIEAQVRRALARAGDASIHKAWEIGRDLAELGAAGQEDALAKAISSTTANSSDHGRLAAAFALRDLADGSIFGKELLAALEPVCESDDTAARSAALELLGDDDLFNRRLSPRVREILEENLSSDLLAPKVRLASARSLWRVGVDRQRRLAKDTMVDFLRSRNRPLQVDAALALAEIQADAQGPGWAILREIAEEPTSEGRLARSYIKREQELRLAARRIRRATMSALPGEEDDGKFNVLEELLGLTRAQHIRGEAYSEDKLIEAAAKGLIDSLDRHSSYFTSGEFKRFFFDLNRNYAGIGAFVNFDADGDFSIVRPIYSGPAYSEGLRSGDKILQVDGWDTAGHTSEEIITRLKGEPNTDVVVQIARPGLVQAQDVPITRRKIQVPSVNSELLPGNVGYLELVTFAQNTADECKKHIRKLQKQGATSFILDVRNNTGGYLVAARDVVELFLPGEKLVVYTQGRDTEERLDYYTKDRAVVPTAPLAVLVNKFSASASEITAGALQDHARAAVVGKRSFGKGSVQTLMPLRTVPPEDYTDDNNNGQHDEWESFQDRNGNDKYDVGAHVKITVARYHLPSGRSLHKEIDQLGKVINPDWGIEPEHEIELRELSPTDSWKNAEIFEIFKQGSFREYVTKHMPDNQDLFLDLAEGDGGETSRYPEFDKFFTDLGTHLDKDDVRRWLRYMIRDEVADLREKAYPGGRAVGDFQEDAQLQLALQVVLEQVGKDIRDVPQYSSVLKLSQADDEDEPAPVKKG